MATKRKDSLGWNCNAIYIYGFDHFHCINHLQATPPYSENRWSKQPCLAFANRDLPTASNEAAHTWLVYLPRIFQMESVASFWITLCNLVDGGNRECQAGTCETGKILNRCWTIKFTNFWGIVHRILLCFPNFPKGSQKLEQILFGGVCGKLAETGHPTALAASLCDKPLDSVTRATIHMIPHSSSVIGIYTAWYGAKTQNELMSQKTFRL